MKPVGVKSAPYIDFNIQNNKGDPRFAEHLKISKYKNIFAKDYNQNWSEEVFMIKKKLKTLCCGHMLLVILIIKKLLEHLTNKNCKKQIKKSLDLEK